MRYLKGATRNQNTSHIDAEMIPLKEELAEQTLHVDLMYVEGEAFLISKSTPAELIMAHHRGHRKGARSTTTIKARLEEQFPVTKLPATQSAHYSPTTRAGWRQTAHSSSSAEF